MVRQGLVEIGSLGHSGGRGAQSGQGILDGPFDDVTQLPTLQGAPRRVRKPRGRRELDEEEPGQRVLGRPGVPLLGAHEPNLAGGGRWQIVTSRRHA